MSRTSRSRPGPALHRTPRDLRPRLETLLIDWRAPAARRSTWPRRSPEGVAPAAHPHPGPQVTAIADESLVRPRPGHRTDRADRRGGAARRAQRRAHRPDARHRPDHPGRAGPDHPRRRSRRARRPGRPGHRQDRGRAAPGGLPALHPPRAAGPQRACWSSARTPRSCATSTRCCPRSARPASSWPTVGSLCPGIAGAPRRQTPEVAEVKGDCVDGRRRRRGGEARPAALARRAEPSEVEASRLRCTGRTSTRRAQPGAVSRAAAQRGPGRLRRATVLEALARRYADQLGENVARRRQPARPADVDALRDESPPSPRAGQPSTRCGRALTAGGGCCATCSPPPTRSTRWRRGCPRRAGAAAPGTARRLDAGRRPAARRGRRAARRRRVAPSRRRAEARDGPRRCEYAAGCWT